MCSLYLYEGYDIERKTGVGWLKKGAERKTREVVETNFQLNSFRFSFFVENLQVFWLLIGHVNEARGQSGKLLGCEANNKQGFYC